MFLYMPKSQCAMRSIKILIPIHTLPHIQSYTTILFENLLPVLRTKSKVQIVWLVYQADKIQSPVKNNVEETILDIHDYNNAVEILRNEKCYF